MMTQSRIAKLVQVHGAVLCAPSQQRGFYILGNSVKSGGSNGSSSLDNSVRGGFVGECLAPALSLS